MTYSCEFGQRREKDIINDLSIYLSNRLNKENEGYFDLSLFLEKMPKNVGFNTCFEDKDPSYLVQAVYNQGHIWITEAHLYNEITVRKLKNIISDYEAETHK